MPRPSLRLPLALLLLPLASCSSTTADEGRVELRLDPNAVEVSRATGDALVIDAPVEIVNASLRTVYLGTCGAHEPAFVIEKLRNGSWESFLYPGPALASIPPRASRYAPSRPLRKLGRWRAIHPPV